MSSLKKYIKKTPTNYDTVGSCPSLQISTRSIHHGRPQIMVSGSLSGSNVDYCVKS